MTRHTLQPENLNPLCFFRSDRSRRLLPLTNVYYVPPQLEENETLDLAIVEIDMNAGIADRELGNALLIDMSLAVPECRPPLEPTSMVVAGYPEETSWVDYDNEEIRNQRLTLHARYVAPASPRYVHRVKISETHNLNSFNGLSGGAVFGWHQHDEDHGQVLLCGMVLQGSVASGLVHFLDAEVLRAAFWAMVGRK